MKKELKRQSKDRKAEAGGEVTTQLGTGQKPKDLNRGQLASVNRGRTNRDQKWPSQSRCKADSYLSREIAAGPGAIANGRIATPIGCRSVQTHSREDSQGRIFCASHKGNAGAVICNRAHRHRIFSYASRDRWKSCLRSFEDLQIIPTREALEQFVNATPAEPGFERQARMLACVLSEAHEHLGLDSLEDVVAAPAKESRECPSAKTSKPRLLRNSASRRGFAWLIDALSVRALRRRVI